MSGRNLAVLRDYVERSTHWTEGGADRHAAMQALRGAEDDLLDIALRVSAATSHLMEIVGRQDIRYALARDGGPQLDRPINARRKYTLKDARRDANGALKLVREAWDIADPSL